MAEPVAGVSVPRRAFIGLVALVLLVCVAALLWERPAAAAAERRVAEVKELLTTFGGRSVDIYCADDFKEGNPSLGSVKVELPPEGVNLEQVEKALIEKALEMADGNVSRAARLLGLSRSALRYRLGK